MPKYLTPAQYEQIKELRQAKLSMKVIAAHFGISEATVSNVLSGKSSAHVYKKKNTFQQKETDSREEEYVELSTLPDDVLFQHVREFNFMG